MRDAISQELFTFLRTEVFPAKTERSLFNQYASWIKGIDLENACKTRRENLEKYLRSFEESPAILIVGEAAGPWGCRFSGVPFTTEKQLLNGIPFDGGERSSAGDEPYPQKTGQAKTANTFWKVLLDYRSKFLAWDCIPFHPHRPDNALSIRPPTTDELNKYGHILEEVHRLINPRITLAVGRKAEKTMKRLKIESEYVCHPAARARNGVKEFTKGIQKIF